MRVTMTGAGGERRRRYWGVRRRRWGKWVSEIRVPGTRERLWLGSYATPEAAAVAHDAAACLLRGPAGGRLNFPERAACYAVAFAQRQPLSPRSVQRVASDAGMAADAQLLEAREQPPAAQDVTRGGIAVDALGGEECAREQWPHAPPTLSGSTGAALPQTGARCRRALTGSRSPSAAGTSEHEHQLVYGDISVDDMEILM